MSVLISCSKEDFEQLNLQNEEEISLEEARNLYQQFESDQNNPAERKSAQRLLNFNRIPLWKKAKERKLSNGKSLLYVPLNYDIKELRLGNKGIRQLLFFKNEKNEMQMRLLELVADSSYLLKNKGQIYQHNFTGMANAYDIKKGFVEGYHFKDGKRTGSIAPLDEILNKSTKPVKARCGEQYRFGFFGADGRYYVLIFYEECGPPPSNSDGGGGFYTPPPSPGGDSGGSGSGTPLGDNYYWMIEENGQLRLLTQSPYPLNDELIKRFKDSVEELFIVPCKNSFNNRSYTEALIEELKNYILNNADRSDYQDDRSEWDRDLYNDAGHPEWFNEYFLILRGVYIRLNGTTRVSLPMVPGYNGPIPGIHDDGVFRYGDASYIFYINTSGGTIQVEVHFQSEFRL